MLLDNCGAIGIQVSKPMDTLELRCDLMTCGGEGDSVVKGLQLVLEATAFSVKNGGDIAHVRTTGRITAFGDDVVAVDIDGRIGEIDVAGGVVASGARSDAVHVSGDTAPDFSHIAITAADGHPIVHLAAAKVANGSR